MAMDRAKDKAKAKDRDKDRDKVKAKVRDKGRDKVKDKDKGMEIKVEMNRMKRKFVSSLWSGTDLNVILQWNIARSKKTSASLS